MAVSRARELCGSLDPRTSH